MGESERNCVGDKGGVREMCRCEEDSAKLKFNAAEEQQVELTIPEGLCVQQDAEIFCWC